MNRGHYCGVSTERWLTILSHDQVSHCPYPIKQISLCSRGPMSDLPMAASNPARDLLCFFFSSFSFPFPLRAPSLQQTKETCGEERRPDLRHTWGRIQRTHGTGEGGQGAIPALHARCNQWVARTTDKTPAHLNKGDIWPCMPAPVLDYDLQSTSAALQQGAGSYGYE